MNDFYDDEDLFDNNNNNNTNNTNKNQELNDVKIDDSHAPTTNPQNLEFHDYEDKDNNDFYGEPQNQPNTPPPNKNINDDNLFTEQEKVEEKPVDSTNASFYQTEYYQPYFNVDSKEVLTRTLLALWPFTSKFFTHIKDNPDLWGPFWISTSLIFLMTASINLENYFTSIINGTSSRWTPDLQKLPWASIAVYGYSGLLPLIFWIVFKIKKIPISLIQFYCTYGYSLFIYLPVSVLTLIAVGKLSFLAWIFISLACVISSAFLVVNFIFIIKPHSNALLALLIPMVLCSVGLALAFKLYLFEFHAVATLAPTTIVPTHLPTHSPSVSPF